jgi:hypothetical protein
MLTTAGSRLATAQINGHMYFRNIFGSIAPVDPPTVEQTAACLGYALKKVESPKKMLDLSFWRDDVMLRHQNPQFCNNKRACSKKSTEVTIFCSGRPNRPTRLVLDVLSFRKKISSHWFRHPLSFCFALVHVYGRWLEE